MNKKRREEIAQLVKQGKSGKEAYLATKKGGAKSAEKPATKKAKSKKAE